MSQQERGSAPAMGMRAGCTGDGALRPGAQYSPRQQAQQQKPGDEQAFVDLCGSSGDEEEEKGQTLVHRLEMAESASTQPPSAVAAAGRSGRVNAVSTASDIGGGDGDSGGSGGGSGSGGGNVHTSASAVLSGVASRGKGSDCHDGGSGNVEGPHEKMGAGLFAAQQLLPVAGVVVRRAYDALLTTSGCVSGQAPMEGYGGGTVGEGERGIGSASSARHD